MVSNMLEVVARLSNHLLSATYINFDSKPYIPGVATHRYSFIKPICQHIMYNRYLNIFALTT